MLASCATDDTVSEPSPFVPTVQHQSRYEVEKVKDVVYAYGYGYDAELDSTVETALMLDVYRPMDITSPRPVNICSCMEEDLWGGQNPMKT